MKDERIQATVNRFAAGGFLVLEFLMWICLCYRMLVLKQHPREWWDIFAIWVIGVLFLSIAYASRGVLPPYFKRLWLTICIVVVVVLLALRLIEGQIHSVVDVGVWLIVVLPACLAATGLGIGILHLLNRRWERKEGIEDEK